MIGEILAWAAIGVAGSLVGMIHPFRRGVGGIAINLAAGVVGAIVAGLVSALAIRDSSPHAGPWHLFFAGLGALVALLAVHTPSVRLRLSKSG
jgi:uncharacterized membrane protein YeaQ/YmgE (transglycosylase-associated protein family)